MEKPPRMGKGPFLLSMQQALKYYDFKPGLPLFLFCIRRVGMYRPALMSHQPTLTEHQFTIGFIDLPDELDPTVDPGARPNRTVIRLSHLLTVCRTFRWGIILKFQNRLKSEADSQRVFEDLRVAISNLYADTQGRGLNADAVLFSLRGKDHRSRA